MCHAKLFESAECAFGDFVIGTFCTNDPAIAEHVKHFCNEKSSREILALSALSQLQSTPKRFAASNLQLRRKIGSMAKVMADHLARPSESVTPQKP
jgi:hypothetical protein